MLKHVMNSWSARENVAIKVESCRDYVCEEDPIEEAYFYLDFEPWPLEHPIHLSTLGAKNGDPDATL